MYHRQLEALIAFASAEPLKPELLAAKAHYFSRTGDVYDDDKSFEMRMASFLDYYLFDWALPPSGKTPAQLWAEAGPPPEGDAALVEGFTRTRHSLWEVRRIEPERIQLRDCFCGKTVDVFERRQPAGLKKGDLIEARLIPAGTQWMFSSAFCFHPEEVKRLVLAQIAHLQRHDAAFSRLDFIWTLSKMRLKLERYRNISPAAIYSFDRRTI